MMQPGLPFDAVPSSQPSEQPSPLPETQPTPPCASPPDGCGAPHAPPDPRGEAPPKSDAGPVAAGPCVKGDSDSQPYASEARRTNRRGGKVRMRATSLAAFAAMGPALPRAWGAVFGAFAKAGVGGLADHELYASLPDWDQNTIRPARIKLVRDGIVVETDLRRLSRARRECIVWRLASLCDGAGVGSVSQAASVSANHASVPAQAPEREGAGGPA